MTDLSSTEKTSIHKLSIPKFGAAVLKPVCMICGGDYVVYEDNISLYFKESRMLACHYGCYPKDLEYLNETRRFLWAHADSEKCIRALFRNCGYEQKKAVNVILTYLKRGFLL